MFSSRRPVATEWLSREYVLSRFHRLQKDIRDNVGEVLLVVVLYTRG